MLSRLRHQSAYLTAAALGDLAVVAAIPRLARHGSQAEVRRRMITVGESPHVSQGRENPQGDFAYSWSVKFLYRDSKNKKYVGRTAIDITDLKRTEKDLQRKQDLLRSLIEVQEKEKQFLCHEFHDGLIQYAIGSLRLLEADQV